MSETNPGIVALGLVTPLKHSVQVFEQNQALVQSVAQYIEEGVRDGEKCFVIAKPSNIKAVKALLGFENPSDKSSIKSEVVFLDAEVMLKNFMRDGKPDPDLFQGMVNELLHSYSSSNKKRIFGEMVGILAEDGNHKAAVSLEGLWNQALRKHQFKLHCGYSISQFNKSAHTDFLGQICDAHDHVTPCESIANLQDADALAREILLLQQKAAALESEVFQRKKAEETLFKRNQELTAFFETAPLGLHWVNENGIIAWANKAELQMLGYSAEEYIGQHISKFHADRHTIETILNCLTHGESIREVHARLICRDGSIKDVLIDSSVLWEEGKFVHTQCFTRDVSAKLKAEYELKLAHENLNEQVNALRRLHDISGQLWDSRDVDSVLLAILQSHVDLHHAQAGLISLFDKNKGSLVVGSQIGIPGDFLKAGICINPGEGACGLAFQKGETVVVDDIKESPVTAPFRRLNTEFGFQSVHSTPLVSQRGHILGVISLLFKSKHLPSSHQVQFADLLARQTADFIERVRSEEALMKLASIVESSEDAIIGKDLDGIITSWNKGASKLFGYQESEIIGKEILVLFPRSKVEEETEIRERILQGEKVNHFETQRRHKNGTVIDVSLTVSPILDNSGKIVGSSTIARDISDRKRAERAKDQFLATLSHELRTPLTPVLMTVSTLRRHEVSKKKLDEMLLSIERNITTEVRLVDELLELSRIVHGKFEIHRDFCPAHDLIIETVETVFGEKKKSYKFETRLSAESDRLFGDKLRLGQVLRNLLDNAFKFTPEQGSIVVHTFNENSEFVISIEDNGRGFEGDPSRLFKAFEQEKSGLQSNGLGLGLSICDVIVRAHGGTMSATSQGRGKGSTFYVRLPLVKSNQSSI